jgi:hypothetical protein
MSCLKTNSSVVNFSHLSYISCYNVGKTIISIECTFKHAT